MLNKKIQNKIIPSLSALALLNTSIYSGVINGQDTVEEIVVTARKKSEGLQDVPVAVSAITEQSLEEKGVNVFEDYLLQLPGVTAGGSGPGNNTIYIRGLASTTPAMTTAGVAGLAPNVSFYLDEQPLAQPGRNLDVYAADISRIEVLSGPQGTLFGASSQSGVVRMITNKPVMGESLSSLEVESRLTAGGDHGGKFEYMSNVPLGNRSALRFVAYKDRRGGYIDQVAGTRSVRESARFRTADTVRANGLVVGSARAGFQAGADLSAASFLDANAIVKENSNPVTYEGFRASVATQINDNWDALATIATQDIESEGVFFVDPDLGVGDMEIQRYSDDYNNDSFDNMSLTLEGTIGDLEVIYAGAYTDRATDQNIDYTDYLFVGQYVPFYICDGVTNYTAVASAGTCQAPDMFVAHTGSTEVTTHEFRVNGDINDSASFTAGVFLSDLEMIEHNEFTYPGSAKLDAQYAPNYPHTNPQPGQGGNAGAGWYSQPGPYNAPIIFVNDILRTDEQKGVFGEVNIALQDNVELTLGARWYDIAVDLEGSANGAYGNKGAITDTGGGGANLSVQYGPNNTNGYPDKAETDGVIGKATLSWKPNEDLMYYLTWSEGFRPGLLNRPAGTSNGAGYTIPAVTDTDEVTNFEFGWKATLMDGALRFNGSAYMVDISGLQSTIFDAAIVNLFFSDNAADAEITGVEGDFVYVTGNGLMLSGAFSLLDTELTKSLVPTSDIVVGSELAFAPGYQGNLAARKEWSMSSGNTGHWQAQMTVSDDSTSDIMEPNRAAQDKYSLFNLRAGVSNDVWTAEVYIDNLTNKRAEVSNTFIFDRERISIVKPRTIGLRYKRNF